MNADRLRLAVGAAVGLSVFAAGAARAQTHDPFMTKVAPPTGPWSLVIAGETGVASFQDIQVPVNTDAGLRGDGTSATTEGATHMGLPLRAGLGVNWQPSHEWSWNVVDLELMNVQAASGPTETQSSSYSRVEIGTRGTYRFAFTDGLSGMLTPTAAFRRSSFANVSTAHYIDAALVGADLGLDWGSVRWTVTGLTAPYASFGYSSQPILGGSELKGSTVSENELATLLSFQAHPGTWIDLGVEREMAHVTISDVKAYNSLGLNVQDTAKPSRVYDLATTMVRFGFHRAL